jgi:putative aminopeptidase FrvX
LIGETETLKELLELAASIGPNEKINDTVQCRIAQYQMKDRVWVDHTTKIFACLYGVDMQDITMENSNE